MHQRDCRAGLCTSFTCRVERAYYGVGWWVRWSGPIWVLDGGWRVGPAMPPCDARHLTVGGSVTCVTQPRVTNVTCDACHTPVHKLGITPVDRAKQIAHVVHKDRPWSLPVSTRLSTGCGDPLCCDIHMGSVPSRAWKGYRPPYGHRGACMRLVGSGGFGPFRRCPQGRPQVIHRRDERHLTPESRAYVTGVTPKWEVWAGHRTPPSPPVAIPDVGTHPGSNPSHAPRTTPSYTPHPLQAPPCIPPLSPLSPPL